MPPLNETWWNFSWQASSPSTQPVSDELFNPLTTNADWSPVVDTSIVNPIDTTIDSTIVPDVSQIQIDDALIQQQALSARVAEWQRDFVNNDLRDLTNEQITAAWVWVAAWNSLIDAEAEALLARNQIDVQTVENLISENDRFTAETEKSASEANRLTKEILQKQQLDTAERNAALVKQKEIETKVLQARATFESQMPGSGFGQSSRAYLSNIIDYTSSKLLSFESDLNIQENNLAIEATNIINQSNQQFQWVLNQNFTRMIQLQWDYRTALQTLESDKITTEARKQVQKSELYQNFLGQKRWLETQFQEDLSAAQNNVLSSYNGLREQHEVRKANQLAVYETDVQNGTAFNYNASQFNDLRKRTGLSVDTLVGIRDWYVRKNVANAIIQSGIEGTPAQIQAITDRAVNYAKLWFPVDEAIARVSGELTSTARDQQRSRNLQAARDEIAINWESAIANAKSSIKVLSTVKQEAKDELIRTWRTAIQSQNDDLPSKELVITARPIGSSKDDLTHECAGYLQTYYGINKYRESDYSLSPYNNKKRIIGEIGSSTAPVVWGLIAWDSWANLPSGGKAGHIGRIVWVDWNTVMVENANLRGDRTVSVDTFDISELKDVTFSNSISTVQKVESWAYNSILNGTSDDKELTANQEQNLQDLWIFRDSLATRASQNTQRPAIWQTGLYTNANNQQVVVYSDWTEVPISQISNTELKRLSTLSTNETTVKDDGWAESILDLAWWNISVWTGSTWAGSTSDSTLTWN